MSMLSDTQITEVLEFLKDFLSRSPEVRKRVGDTLDSEDTLEAKVLKRYMGLREESRFNLSRLLQIRFSGVNGAADNRDTEDTCLTYVLPGYTRMSAATSRRARQMEYVGLDDDDNE